MEQSSNINPMHQLENKLFIDFVKFQKSDTLSKLKNSSDDWFLFKIKQILKNESDSKYLLEESWSLIIQKRQEYDITKASFRTWAFNKIILGKALQFNRNQQKNISLDIYDNKYATTFISEYNPEDELIRSEFQKQCNMNFSNIIKNVYDLKDKYRDVILLHYLGSRKMSEIANIVNKSEENIKVWNMRAKTKLKEALSKKKISSFNFFNINGD